MTNNNPFALTTTIAREAELARLFHQTLTLKEEMMETEFFLASVFRFKSRYGTEWEDIKCGPERLCVEVYGVPRRRVNGPFYYQLFMEASVVTVDPNDGDGRMYRPFGNELMVKELPTDFVVEPQTGYPCPLVDITTTLGWIQIFWDQLDTKGPAIAKEKLEGLRNRMEEKVRAAEDEEKLKITQRKDDDDGI